MAKVTLGEVAVECRESCRGDKSGLPAVGLEHLTPGQIRLSSWAVNTENTFTKLFRRDDMLFGRRRAYLKKAAQAPFDGICSGDITVIRARPGKLLPELLPFIIQNDDLFDFAVGRSDGSLSPRVKWENLANYTFELPPLAEQKKLAEVLWSISDTIQAYQDLLTKTEELVKARFAELFGNIFDNPKGFQTCRFGDYVRQMNIGPFGSDLKNDCFVSKEDGYCMVYEQKHAIDKDISVEARYVTEQKYWQMMRFDIGPGDIIVSCRGTIGKCFLLPEDAPHGIIHPSLMMIKPKDTVNHEFLLFLLENILKEQQEQGTGVKMAIKAAELAKIVCVAPPRQLQDEYVAFVNQADQSKSALQRTITSLQETKRSLAAEALCMGRKE